MGKAFSKSIKIVMKSPNIVYFSLGTSKSSSQHTNKKEKPMAQMVISRLTLQLVKKKHGPHTYEKR